MLEQQIFFSVYIQDIFLGILIRSYLYPSIFRKLDWEVMDEWLKKMHYLLFLKSHPSKRVQDPSWISVIRIDYASIFQLCCFVHDLFHRVPEARPFFVKIYSIHGLLFWDRSLESRNIWPIISFYESKRIKDINRCVSWAKI
jgi:hypothetical protein